MKITLFVFLIPALLWWTGGEAYSQVKSKKVLFNGKNLDGWYTFLRDRGRNQDPRKVFTVQDGSIRISGEEWGCITTNEEFDNYRLTVEFRWAGPAWGSREKKARDSGVLLHSVGEDGAYSGIWMRSIEVQLIEGGTGDFIVVGDGSKNFAISSPVAPEKQCSSYLYKPGGELATINGGRVNWLHRAPEWEDVIDFRGAKDVEKKVGKWNKLECVASGDNIDVYLNGKLVNQAVKVKPSRGRIQIQSEGAEVWVRKVELKPL